MPYITQERRAAVASSEMEVQTPGELNFLLTSVCFDYWNNKPENYQTYNDILGALEACKMEWYRRMVVPYEDKKIAQNGDVFPC